MPRLGSGAGGGGGGGGGGGAVAAAGAAGGGEAKAEEKKKALVLLHSLLLGCVLKTGLQCFCIFFSGFLMFGALPAWAVELLSAVVRVRG